MKPMPIKQDTTFNKQQFEQKIELPPKAKSVKVEIPVIGSIESDSGNHMMDIGTVLGIIVVLFIIKKLIG